MLPKAAMMTKPTMAGNAHGRAATRARAASGPPRVLNIKTIRTSSTKHTPIAPTISKNLSTATPAARLLPICFLWKIRRACEFAISPEKYGAPDRIRTCDLWNRNPTLYPAELRVQRSRLNRVQRLVHTPALFSHQCLKIRDLRNVACFWAGWGAGPVLGWSWAFQRRRGGASFDVLSFCRNGVSLISSMLLPGRAAVLPLSRRGGRMRATPFKCGAGRDFIPSKLAGK